MQLNLDLAMERGAMASQACADKADKAAPGWTNRAVELLGRFARHQQGVFTIEMARSVIEPELDAPHDLRAWGSVTRRAVTAGLIKRVSGSTAPAVSSNGSPKPLYRRGVEALRD